MARERHRQTDRRTGDLP